jgi:hypothetical protein
MPSAVSGLPLNYSLRDEFLSRTAQDLAKRLAGTKPGEPTQGQSAPPRTCASPGFLPLPVRWEAVQGMSLLADGSVSPQCQGRWRGTRRLPA